MNRNNFIFLVSKYWWWVALLCGPSLAHAATAPALLTNSTYGVVSSTWNDTTSSPVTGAGCTTTLSGTPSTTAGPGAPGVEIPCPAQRGFDQGTALTTLTTQACTSLGGGAVVLDAVNLGSGAGVFTPGCYSSGGAMSIGIGATVTLNGAGVYIFKTTGGAPATLNTGNNSIVAVTAGACESDVFWAPQGATTLGATTTFRGSILGSANAITVGTTTNIIGRLLSAAGVVTTDTDTIAVPTCAPYAGPFAPTLSKAFVPATISAGGVSLLTVTLTNPDAAVATLTAPLIDTLPGGVVIAPTPGVSTTCGGVGAPVAVAGGSTVTLPAGRSIPANGSCTMSVNVTAVAGGPYTNTLAAGALATSNGSNAALASAVLTIGAGGGSSDNNIPTLSEWGMIILAGLLALFGFVAVRRQAR